MSKKRWSKARWVFGALERTRLVTHHHRAVVEGRVVYSHDTPGAGMLRQLTHIGDRCPFGLCTKGQKYIKHTPSGDEPATGRGKGWHLRGGSLSGGR